MSPPNIIYRGKDDGRKNTINFEEVEGRELEKLKEKALSNQSVQALVSYSLDNYFSQKRVSN
ncbi:hypothetical protein ACT7DA_24255 [Bacillus pacificus]